MSEKAPSRKGLDAIPRDGEGGREGTARRAGCGPSRPLLLAGPAAACAALVDTNPRNFIVERFGPGLPRPAG